MAVGVVVAESVPSWGAIDVASAIVLLNGTTNPPYSEAGSGGVSAFLDFFLVAAFAVTRSA